MLLVIPVSFFYTPMKSSIARLIAFFGITGSSLVIGSVAFAATQPTRPLTSGAPQRFLSCSVLKSRIVSARQGSGSNIFAKRAMPMMAPSLSVMDAAVSAGSAESSPTSAIAQSASPTDYSTTNVQVQGVDEADIVKQDGEYVYHLTQNRLAITRANPPTEAQLSSITTFDSNFSAQNLYIEGERLTVIGNSWDNGPSPEPIPMMGRPVTSKMMPIWRGRNTTRVEIYDISKRDQIKKLRTLEFDGNISTSRLINGRMYVVMNSWSNWEDGESVSSANLVPNYSDSATGNVARAMLPCGNVAYFDRGPADSFIAIASIPMSGTGDIQRSAAIDENIRSKSSSIA
jgi:hypothetical protein